VDRHFKKIQKGSFQHYYWKGPFYLEF